MNPGTNHENRLKELGVYDSYQAEFKKHMTADLKKDRELVKALNKKYLGVSLDDWGIS